MEKVQKYGVGIIAILALIFALLSFNNEDKSVSYEQDLVEKVLSKGEINAGYIVYDPYIIQDPETGDLSGFSYELAELIAERLNIKINWAGESAWGTATEDLKVGRYDMMGVLMWPNSSRARNAYFSEPVMYSTVYAYSRADDDRFDNGLDVLTSGEYKLSTLDGEMSSFIAKESYPNAPVVELPALSSVSEILLNITTGKADITFVDPTVANNFLESNPGSIKQASDELVRTFGNSYVFPRGEDAMLRMWNVALQELANEGKVEELLNKYDIRDSFLLEKKTYE